MEESKNKPPESANVISPPTNVPATTSEVKPNVNAPEAQKPPP